MTKIVHYPVRGLGMTAKVHCGSLIARDLATSPRSRALAETGSNFLSLIPLCVTSPLSHRPRPNNNIYHRDCALASAFIASARPRRESNINIWWIRQKAFKALGIGKCHINNSSNSAERRQCTPKGLTETLARDEEKFSMYGDSIINFESCSKLLYS